jgi:hypothetical protein
MTYGLFHPTCREMCEKLRAEAVDRTSLDKCIEVVGHFFSALRMNDAECVVAARLKHPI